MRKDAGGKLHPSEISGAEAATGHALVWNGVRYKPGPVATAVLFVSTAAGGPPTDGSVLWYVTDETC